MNEILKLINEYQQIVLYRHIQPDLDAFGSQLGMYHVLKDLYPSKNIVLQGDMTSDLLKMYASVEVSEIKPIKSLGIVLDTANRERIDGNTELCDVLIKIDHHIIVDSYGTINIEVETASSCSEVVTLLLKENHISIPVQAAEALYLGIIGDSNRFLYASTTQKTFEAASYLLDYHIDIEKLYQLLYLKSKEDLKIHQFIYNHIKEDQGVAWYYMSNEDLNDLHISRDKGSQYVNTLANIKEYPIWMAVTQNLEKNNFRVSIRSRQIAINDVASHFRGGGHAFASGVTLESLDELPLLVNQLKEKIYGKNMG